MSNVETNQKNEEVGFLDDNQGNRSSIRLMSFISLGAAILFGYMELTSKADPPYITMMFLLGAFAPKALQKFIEDKVTGVKK